jgi:hypothetical protein
MTKLAAQFHTSRSYPSQEEASAHKDATPIQGTRVIVVSSIAWEKNTAILKAGLSHLWYLNLKLKKNRDNIYDPLLTLFYSPTSTFFSSQQCNFIGAFKMMDIGKT